MKNLNEYLKESLFIEAINVSFDNDKEMARNMMAEGADKLIELLISPSKLNKYFKEIGVNDKSDKMEVYNFLSGLVSDLYTWMTESNIYDDIETDDDMINVYSSYRDNIYKEFDSKNIDFGYEIFPKLWKDVVKFDWIWK